MPPLDGHYHHRGATISWDDAGVTLSRVDEQLTASAAWSDIDGVRQIGEGPGWVQILVRGHVPPGDLRHDPFSIAVNSDPDANRLVTNIGWRATSERGAGAPRETWRSPWRRQRVRRA